MRLILTLDQRARFELYAVASSVGAVVVALLPVLFASSPSAAAGVATLGHPS